MKPEINIVNTSDSPKSAHIAFRLRSSRKLHI